MQGVFANIVFVVVSVFLLALVSWGEISSVLSVSEPGHSRINPFDTSAIQHFGILFFVISLIEVLYGQMSWQGEQAYYSSARTAHEARMGGILRLWFLQVTERRPRAQAAGRAQARCRQLGRRTGGNEREGKEGRTEGIHGRQPGSPRHRRLSPPDRNRGQEAATRGAGAPNGRWHRRSPGRSPGQR